MGKDRGLFLELDAHPTRAHRIISSCAPLLDFPVFAVPMVPPADIGVHLPEKNIFPQGSFWIHTDIMVRSICL